jgi:photosystem II oxygen-evolving enhancer protein 2
VDAVPAPSRRNVLALGAALAFAAPGAAQAKVPAGFNAVKDTQKGYAFVYPVGWSEVALEGQDKAFKDVIEPLESVSLSVLPTERTSLAQAGTPQEVAQALVSKASSPSTRTELVSASQRTDSTGKAPVVYYSFEFTSAARGVTRHAITTLAIANGALLHSSPALLALTPPRHTTTQVRCSPSPRAPAPRAGPRWRAG